MVGGFSAGFSAAVSVFFSGSESDDNRGFSFSFGASVSGVLVVSVEAEVSGCGADASGVDASSARKRGFRRNGGGLDSSLVAEKS